jgi:DNA mismatch endonuclease, patch repair protein
MRLIRGKNTSTELSVRSLVHRLGYRYSLHSRSLPGKPDIVFNSRQKAIFIHGCFWHLHKRCDHYRLPKSRLDFWLPKLEGNRNRDRKVQKELKHLGWKILVIWECDLGKMPRLERNLVKFLEAK